jgi:hypothetical protein
MRLRAITIAFASTACFCGFAAAATDVHQATKMTVATQGRHVQATLASFCWTDPPDSNGISKGICADMAAGPPGNKPLPIRRHHRLVIRTGGAPTAIAVSLLGGASNGWQAAAAPTNAEMTRWTVRLPGSVKGAREIDLSADYRDGKYGGVVPFRVAVVRRG